MWTSVTPELPVRNVAETQAWYRDVLGFRVTYTYGESFAAVVLGRTEIFFSRADGPIAPACCCIRVDDADALYAIYVERGADIVDKIDLKPWGMREFTLRDPNGHRFRIGTSTREVGR